MKYLRFLWIVPALGALSPVARAADVSSTTLPAPIADWSFIQSVGGMKLGPAVQQAQSTWELPLLCDLSGKQAFTQSPTVSNTGTLIQKTIVQQEAGNIYISLVVTQTAWTLTPERSQCRSVKLDSTARVHPVFYKDGAGKTFPIGYTEFNNDSEVLKNGQ